mgnify:CR=1 FL=1
MKLYRNFRLGILISALGCISILMASPVFAEDEDIPYPARVPYKIVRGVTNIALGWTEIFLRPFGEHETESIGESLGMGYANTLIRFMAGFVDVTTFWVPDIQMLDLYPDWQGWPYLFHWS